MVPAPLTTPALPYQLPRLTIHRGGWVGIHWPKAYGGRGATVMEQTIYRQEMGRGRLPEIANFMGTRIAVPINGRKVWISFAQYARFCLLLEWTDPAAPKHKGISCLVVDMRTPGITVRFAFDRRFAEYRGILRPPR